MTSNGGDSEVFNACDRKAVSGEPWGYSLKAKIKGRLRVNGAKLVIIGDRRRKRAWRTALSAYTIEKGKPNGKCRIRNPVTVDFVNYRCRYDFHTNRSCRNMGNVEFCAKRLLAWCQQILCGV